jgi:hypothetical protein
MRRLILSSAVGLTAALASGAALAQTYSPPSWSGSSQSQQAEAAHEAALPAPEHTLIGSVLSSNGGAVVIRATGIAPIDARSTVTCPGTVSCEIEAQENIQVSGGPGGRNRFGLCVQVDGVFLNRPPCPFLGIVDPNSWSAGNFTQYNYAAAPGTHTVRLFLYSDFGALTAGYAVTYRIYQ